MKYLAYRTAAGACMAVAWLAWPTHLGLLALFALLFVVDLERSHDQEDMRKAFLDQMRGIWAEVFYTNQVEREQVLKFFDDAMRRRFK